MEPFDIIKSFTKEDEWEKISMVEKAKNFFIINRMMSIKYPLQAHGFNLTRIDPAQSVNWWRSMIAKNYQTYPGFIFTSTSKREKKEASKPIPTEIVKWICDKHQIGKKEIESLEEFFPKEWRNYGLSIKEMLS